MVFSKIANKFCIIANKICMFTHLFVPLASPKVLSFGKITNKICIFSHLFVPLQAIFFKQR